MGQECVFHTFYQSISPELAEKMKKIRLVVFDVDGTMTDGRIILDNENGEVKHFNCRDGMGIALLRRAGITSAIITGRTSPLTERRARELKIPYVIQGQADKTKALKGLIQELNLERENVAAMGDDINDLPLFDNAAVSATPADGYQFMRCRADLVLTSRGGHDAVREFSDMILMAQGFISPQTGAPLFHRHEDLAVTNDPLTQ